jgi:chromosome partitioning protein
MLILIGHHKGGVGKSTLTVNLAAELQRQGQRVCIVEADPTVKTTSNWAADRVDAGGQPIKTEKITGNLYTRLMNLDKEHDVVLVDAAGKDSKELRTAMTACDLLMAPLLPSQPDLDTSVSLLESVKTARQMNPDLKLMGVLNRVSPHVWDDEEAESREYMTKYPDLVLARTVVHDRKVFRKAMGDGKGAVETRDRKAKAEIQLLLQEALTW